MDLLKIREENIARNNTFLANLGLSPGRSEMSKDVDAEKQFRQKSRKKRSIEEANNKILIEPTRRSSRNIGKPAVEYKEIGSMNYELTTTSENTRRSNRSSVKQPFDYSYTDEDWNEDDLKTKSINQYLNKGKDLTPIIKTEADPKSSRSLTCEYEQFINKLLCVPLDAPTKAEVMSKSYSKGTPKFSKYSGVVEWSNCVYLWVNIANENCDYPNEMREDGKLISWFGGSRMHADTPVVNRFTNPNKKGKDKVLLFVRFEKEYYTCLDVVIPKQCFLDTHPISCIWELKNYEEMCQRSTGRKCETFIKNRPQRQITGFSGESFCARSGHILAESNKNTWVLGGVRGDWCQQ